MRKIPFSITATLLIITAITLLEIASQSSAPVNPRLDLPVFPGAEGFGTRTPAGRGGKLIEVTSLADDGPGTLRAALDTRDPRIIVFRVGGTIELRSELFIKHPFVTIAGQSAPGDGILIKNAAITILTHDVLVHHIRVRPGNEGNVSAEVNDAITVLGPHGKIHPGAYNVVLDHISASWGEDETISVLYGAHDVTISWSIISEALDRSRHSKKTHSAGLLIGTKAKKIDRVSIHHNLLAHNDFRNPLFSHGGTHDFVNNVVYNWGHFHASEIIDAKNDTFINFIGNRYIAGPSTDPKMYEIFINSRGSGGIPKLFQSDNIGPNRPQAGMEEHKIASGNVPRLKPEDVLSATPFPTPPITRTDWKTILADAGATRPTRDAVDRRIVSEVERKTGRIIDSPRDVGGYPIMRGGTPPQDTDRDGMPDWWEKKIGLDPNDPSDGNEDRDRDGYTNIEEYLHSLLK